MIRGLKFRKGFIVRPPIPDLRDVPFKVANSPLYRHDNFASIQFIFWGIFVWAKINPPHNANRCIVIVYPHRINPVEANNSQGIVDQLQCQGEVRW